MSRTSPFFLPQKEIDTIDSMNEELIDEIIGQSVDIYKVSIDNTDENISSKLKKFDLISKKQFNGQVEPYGAYCLQ